MKTKIYACAIENHLVGEYTGNIEETINHIKSICEKFGFIENKQLQIEREILEDGTNSATISMDYEDRWLSVNNPLFDKVQDVATELMDFGDVRGDYPSTYYLKEETPQKESTYRIIGSFSE